MPDQNEVVIETPKPKPPIVPGETAIREQLAAIRPAVAEANGSNPEDDDPILKAKQLVVDNYNASRNPSRSPEMKTDFVTILWFTGSRGNFKAMCELTAVHGLVFAVSYNALRRQAYIDVYKKTHNVKLDNV